MPVVKDKIILCHIGLADFAVESVNEVPFYRRYYEFCKLFASKVPSIDFEKCFAQPQENNAKKIIEWYYSPGNEVPMKLTEIKAVDPDLYQTCLQQRQRIIADIQAAKSKSNENEQKYLNAVLVNLEQDYIDSITYCYDDHILIGVWGMRTKTGRQIDSVITEGVLDHRAYKIAYQVEGMGKIAPFTTINRRYGHILHGDKDIPRVIPEDGYIFKEWVPEAPHGKEVKSDLVYTAVCEKPEEIPNEGTSGTGETKGPGEAEGPSGPENEKRRFQVRFNTGEHGVPLGQAWYEKEEGDAVRLEEVPSVESQEGYKFIGWDKNPDGYVVTEDVEFVAQYEEVPPEEELFKVRFDQGDHGILHGQTLYEKHKNETVYPSEVPDVEADDGYRFVGWDKDPNNHVVTEDVVFVAQYEEVKESWWSRFWGWGSGCLNWLLTLLLLGLIGLLLWYLLSGYRNFNFCGCDCDEIVVPVDPGDDNKVDTIVDNDDLPEPTTNCGVHFSGLVLSDEDSEDGIATIFSDDRCGEYVGQGYYPDNAKTFPNAVRTTFDAIAVDNGTHLIIYSEHDFKGEVLLDVVGPALITNVLWKNDNRYNIVANKTFTPELQALFPPSRRQWSSGNMHGWSYGSCKIICE